MSSLSRALLASAVATGVSLVAGIGGSGPPLGAVAASTQVASPPPTPPPSGTGVLKGMASELNDPTGMPPGVVNGPCILRDHPYPVVLVHGTFANANFSWQTLAPMLAGAGYCVFALDYGANQSTAQFGNHTFAVDAIEQSAAELAAFIDTVVIPDTGASQVDIVGHSQGGLMPRYFIEHDWDCSGSSLGTNAYGDPYCAPLPGSDTGGATIGATCRSSSPIEGAACVHTMVGLAPSNHGADAYGLVPLFVTLFGPSTYTFPGAANCPACAEQEAGSPFLTALNGTDGSLEATPGVLYYVLETADDTIVTPAPNPVNRALGVWPSAFLHGRPNTTGQVLNTVLQDQCPTDATDHIGIIYDPVALEDVMQALDNTGSSTGAGLPQPTCPPVVLPVVSG
jgi:hypothetical protein